MAARNRSNSDHTRLISKSIFVTNFPDNTSAKDLWEVCKGYGTVVDVFIPNRKSRSGKRFAFVRFIKVGNVDRLVENLCTLWIGRMHLHANVVRYDRPPISSSRPNVAPRPTVKSVSRPSANGASSFVSVLKGNLNTINRISTSPAMHVRLVYLGGLWVMIELPSIETKTREQIVWIDIEGVPLHAWSCPTFSKIGSRWGEVLELEDNKDDCFARKRICIKTKQEDNILEKFKIIVRGKIFVVRAKELFVWSPSFKGVNDAEFVSDDDSGNGEEEKNDDMSKKDKGEENTGLDSSLPFPPGFTPADQVKSDIKNSPLYSHSRGLNSRVLEESQPTKDQGSPKDNLNQRVGGYYIGGYSDMIKQSGHLEELRSNLRDIDKELDQGGTNEVILQRRLEILKNLHDINSANARDYMQKAKIQWAIEGDKNSKFFHGIINRKRANLAIKGVMLDGDWVDDPCHVKEEFRLHFANRFRAPVDTRYKLNYTFPNKLQPDQMATLESPVSRDEVRNAVWGCGENKSSGPDGFSFEFFRKFWDTAWEDTIGKLKARLSNWKLKTLSVGGRLTLLKSVLGSTPIYNLSIYKAPKSVLHSMESLRRNFFNGSQCNERKIAWIKWTTTLASKKNGGLDSSVAVKLSSVTSSLRRPVRGGSESSQLSLLIVGDFRESIRHHSVAMVQRYPGRLIWTYAFKRLQLVIV
ncbi:RNA-directed DNA polymerase, eukaryota [Tanacetum coccineum]